MSTITCVLFIVSPPLLLCLCGKPLSSLYPMRVCRLARFSISLHFLRVGKGIFISISSASVCLGDLAKNSILCVSGLVLSISELGTATTLISWAHWQVCSAAGSFLKVARPVDVLSVMPQQGVHVTTFKHNSVSIILLEVPCMISRTLLNSASAGVILVVDDHFGIGLCFQLFLCFQLLIAQLAVEILSFKVFDVLN